MILRNNKERKENELTLDMFETTPVLADLGGFDLEQSLRLHG